MLSTHISDYDTSVSLGSNHVLWASMYSTSPLFYRILNMLRSPNLKNNSCQLGCNSCPLLYLCTTIHSSPKQVTHPEGRTAIPCLEQYNRVYRQIELGGAGLCSLAGSGRERKMKTVHTVIEHLGEEPLNSETGEKGETLGCKQPKPAISIFWKEVQGKTVPTKLNSC